MKKLFIMRHAKSDWGASFEADHDRPLARRGEKAARRIGRFLSENDSAPELIISSTATRAQTTAVLASEAGGWSCQIRTDSNLYSAGIEDVLDVVAGVEPGVGSLLIAGHEPTSSMLVSWLIGGGRVGMPTAAVACLDFPHGDWTDLAQGTCELRWFITPKMLTSRKSDVR